MNEGRGGGQERKKGLGARRDDVARDVTTPLSPTRNEDAWHSGEIPYDAGGFGNPGSRYSVCVCPLALASHTGSSGQGCRIRATFPRRALARFRALECYAASLRSSNDQNA